MSDKRVWYPDRSYTAAQEGSEESGRGSLHASSAEQQEPESSTAATKRRSKAVITRRRTPTVCIPASKVPSADSTPTPSSSGQARPNYQTIETTRRYTLHELSSKVYTESATPPPKNHNWFCGWTEFEHLDLYQSGKLTNSGNDYDRTRLQTPADGNRSSLHSRVSSSRYMSSRGSRRYSQYVFHHHADVAQYMEDYRSTYSYTGLTTGYAHTAGHERAMFCEGEDVEQDEEVTLPVDVKSLYRGDPYLRELMHRLGVKGPPVTPEYERPRPTPPSIVKRRRNGREVEIVVSNSAPKKEELAEESDETTEYERDNSNEKAIPPELAEDGSVELPKITHSSQIAQLLQQIHRGRNNKQKSTSVISVQKYLQVRSGNQDTLTEEEGDEDEDQTDNRLLENGAHAEREGTKSHERKLKVFDSVGTRLTKDEHLPGHDDDRSKERDIEFQNKIRALNQEQLLTLTKGQREKIISNTAHALGVVSHDWNKVPGLRKAYDRTTDESESGKHSHDRHVSSSSSPSRQTKTRTEHRNQTESRMGYRNQITTPLPPNKGSVKTEAADSTKAKSADKDKQIEKLKSIYDSTHQQPKTKSKSVHSSRQPSRCASRYASRPATRMQVYKTYQQQQQQQEEGKSKRYSQTRPSTRMTHHHHNPNRTPSRDTNLESLEESTYWNEIRPREKTKSVKKPLDMSNTATVFGVVGHAENSKRSADILKLQKSLKRSFGTDEGFLHSHLRTGTQKGGAHRKDSLTGPDKIAQAISLAMKFRKPRESLMRKLTGGVGGNEISKTVHQS